MKVVSLNQYKTEKQYKAVGSEWSYIPNVDNVQPVKKVEWTAKDYQKALMKMNNKII